MADKELHRRLLGLTAEYIVSKFPESCFVECGVQSGQGAVILAQAFRRQGYLFDTWEGIPHYDDRDIPTVNHRRALRKAMYKAKKNMLKNKPYIDRLVYCLRGNHVEAYCQLVKGDICATVPEFAKQNPKLSIGLLHVDSNLYRPTLVSLTKLWERMVDGGIMFVDDYGDLQWPGVKQAVDEFMINADFPFCTFEPAYDACVIVKGTPEMMNEYERKVLNELL